MSQQNQPSDEPLLNPELLERLKNTLSPEELTRLINPAATPEYEQRFAELMEGITPLPELLRPRRRRRRELSPEDDSFIHKPWPGSKSWHNWGVGLDRKGRWHLFHYQRWGGAEATYRWARHRFARVAIPRSAVSDLARRFLKDGFASYHPKIKYIVSRLRAIIRTAVKGEGHKPEGDPLPHSEEHKEYRPAIRFGRVRKKAKRYVFTPRE